MINAVFAGSFDPPTYGHINVIKRASALFEKLYVVVAVNQGKKYSFSEDERISFMKTLTSEFSNVEVYACNTLIVDFAKEHNCKVLVRGVRSVQDFSYEFELSIMNRGVGPEIETLFMPTEQRYFVLRSSAIKELASFGGDVSSMVPPLINDALKNRFRNNKN